MTAVTGDCLFPGGVGKTWRDGDFERLLDGVSSKVFDVYDDSTVVYPGHGDRHHARDRTATPRRVARARLVAADVP
jgi:glyoxylase-like metal-dependent hydrolase (beta-lactamase superfamily II)